MREIKFRGKSLDNGEWLYGSLLSWKNGCTDMLIEYDICEMLDDIPVDTETVGQYTGLRDKTGREIYEGDIVKFRLLNDSEGEGVWKEYTEEVSFCNGCFCTNGTPLIQGKWKGQNMANVEVIGNIHDNPELINK